MPSELRRFPQHGAHSEWTHSQAPFPSPQCFCWSLPASSELAAFLQWTTPTAQLCCSGFIVASLAILAEKARSFSFKAKENLVSHLPRKDFVQTLSNPIKKLTFKGATHCFFFPRGILTLISPQGFSKKSSNKVIACYLKQGGRGFQEKLTQVHPVQNGEPVGHNKLLLVLSTWLGSAEWSWVGCF